MKALVDYRNLPAIIRQKGLPHLADRVATSILALLNPAPRVLQLRLYSGWDRGQTLTQEAQRLASEAAASFPKIRQGSSPLTISVELAHSLETLPRKRLSNKLRMEPLSSRVRFKKPSLTTCRNQSCPIDVLYDFFQRGSCNVVGCAGTVEALAEQEHQKLVDTMLVADLIYLATSALDPICLVGSDDDMWPGILSVLANGRHLIHLQTKSWVGNSPYLVPNLGTYEQKAL